MTFKNIQTEVDASFLYDILATHEEDPNVAEIFRQMSDIERSHALAFMANHFHHHQVELKQCSL